MGIWATKIAWARWATASPKPLNPKITGPRLGYSVLVALQEESLKRTSYHLAAILGFIGFTYRLHCSSCFGVYLFRILYKAIPKRNYYRAYGYC